MYWDGDFQIDENGIDALILERELQKCLKSITGKAKNTGMAKYILIINRRISLNYHLLRCAP